MKDPVAEIPYAERERLLSADGRKLLEATWATFAKRVLPGMPEAEAIGAFKELHAAGLIELVSDDSGETIELRLTHGTG